MVKGTLGWNKGLKVISCVITVFWFILTIAAIITNQELPGIILFGVFSMLCVILTLYLFLYKICVYEDKIEIKSLFGRNIYNYLDVIIRFGNSIMVSNLEDKELARIACFFDPNTIIAKTYNSFCKKNNIKHNCISNKVKYNYYFKNFSVFGLIYSLAMFAIFLIILIQRMANINVEVLTNYMFLVLGIIALIPSIVGILAYKNFEITIDNKEIVFKNWLGFKSIYIIETLNFEFTGKIIKIILPNKKTKRLVYAFLDNKDRLINYIRN